ncbi:hypothetical protein D3C78_1138110 [compost metagenome]
MPDIGKPVAALVMQHIGIIITERFDYRIPDAEIGAERIDEGDDRLACVQSLDAIMDHGLAAAQKMHDVLLLSGILQACSG